MGWILRPYGLNDVCDSLDDGAWGIEGGECKSYVLRLSIGYVLW